MFDYTPPRYSPEQLESMAKTGSLREKVIVASRTNVRPEILSWLMANEPDREIALTIIGRSDVTAEQLEWAGQSGDPFVMNRVVAHSKTLPATITRIRDYAAEQQGQVWELLLAYANRVLKRQQTGQFEWEIRGKLPEPSSPDSSDTLPLNE